VSRLAAHPQPPPSARAGPARCRTAARAGRSISRRRRSSTTSRACTASLVCARVRSSCDSSHEATSLENRGSAADGGRPIFSPSLHQAHFCLPAFNGLTARSLVPPHSRGGDTAILSTQLAAARAGRRPLGGSHNRVRPGTAVRA
jgi:hypothetical protein